MDALRNTANTGELFGRESIQSIVQAHWNFWNPYFVWLKLVPFAIHFITFFVWSNFLLPTKAAEGGYEYENQGMVWIICLTAIYFDVADLIRFCKAPKECCTDPLKILEFIGTTLLIYNSLYSVIFNDDFTVEFWRI